MFASWGFDSVFWEEDIEDLVCIDVECGIEVDEQVLRHRESFVGESAKRESHFILQDCELNEIESDKHGKKIKRKKGIIKSIKKVWHLRIFFKK